MILSSAVVAMLYHVLSIFGSVDEIIIKVLRSIRLLSCGVGYYLVYKGRFLLRLSPNRSCKFSCVRIPPAQ